MQRFRKHLQEVYLVHRGYGSGRKFVSDLAQRLGVDGVLLDIGCGEGRLRRELLPGATYVGFDRRAGLCVGEYEDWNIKPDVIGDAHQLPFIDQTFSVVSMMHVVEHLSDPGRAFSEVNRVLRQNGYLFMDVPFLHQIHHAPHDFFRFTPYALRELAKKNGFRVIEILPSGGYFRFISYALRQAPSMVAAVGWYERIVRVVVCWPLALLGIVVQKIQYLLDICDGEQKIVCGYHAVFEKFTDDKPIE